jgi:hypothetical protein
MTTMLHRAGQFNRFLCVTLATVLATAPSISALAQTNAAAMAVRQRVEGLQGAPGPEGQATPQPQNAPGPGQAPGQPLSADQSAGKVDTRYISPDAGVVVIMRPAQLLSAPIAQMLPVELVAAFLGFDPTEIDEIVAFGNPPTTGINYGITLKFKNPVRATSIPLERRTHVQLADLGGKKYLKSGNPMLYSLYAPNNRTLVAATDATLQQLVSSAGQPKSGPMMDRLRDVPAGGDLYLNVDVASLRPFIPLLMGGDPAKAPPALKQQLEILSLISAAELTLNLSNPAPSSFVVRCTDDAAAQKLDSLIQEARQKYNSGNQQEQPGGISAVAQARTRYRERFSQMFPVQRDGNSFTFFRVDGQNSAQQQFVSAVVVLAASAASIVPEVMAGREAAMRAQAGQNAGVPPGIPGAPGSPEPGQR